MRLKITDGDLLLVQINADMSEDGKKSLHDLVSKWIKDKDLKNVSAYLVPVRGGSLGFQILSVNDVFETEVLK